tara:strand:- start:750 stop:3902 length:3153 start_codon:yes stop_codon:yes gene_type:complete
MPKILPVCKENYELVKKPCKCIKKTIKKNRKKRTKKKTLKLKIELNKSKNKISTITSKMNDRTQDVLSILTELKDLMAAKKQRFQSNAYNKSIEKIVRYNKPIYSTDELKEIFGETSSTFKHLKQYFDTGKVNILEKHKNDPIKLFTKIYGVGPKKALEFKNKGFTNLQEIKERQDELLTTAQKYGLQYFDDIQKRIPRKEIVQYHKKFTKAFNKIKKSTSKFEIVGSYRRGAKDSGDIDLIITDSKNDISVFTAFIEELQNNGLLVAILSKGEKKSLTIGRIKNKPARRLDFLYSSPDEYPFATLYFTGSKYFNVAMRQRAIDLGYTLNEHGLYHFKNRKKGNKISQTFQTEKDIFDFLGMTYKEPTERLNTDAVVFLEESKNQVIGETKTHNKTIKKRKLKKKLTLKNIKAFKTCKEKLIEFSNGGITFLNSLDETSLTNMIRFASYHYYHKKAIISDNAFDILKEYVEKKYPNNPVLQEVGAELIEKNKVALPYYMGSMDKIKPDTNAVQRWKKKYTGPYVISGKLDGISALYSTENGEKKLYTRGKATEGMDISYMIPYLKLPNDEDITIRGELIIQMNKFNKKYKGESKGQYKSARNFVAGTVNAKQMDPDKFSDIDFVAYEVIKPTIKISEQMDWLTSHNVITVRNITTNSVDNESLSKILVDWRDSYEYEIDGIIVADDNIHPRKNKNPKHAFAFKMVLSDQIMESKVVDIIWTPSKHGYLKPRVRIEPINIKGATIEFATGHNADFIFKNKIGIGALVEIIRSGDVIPKIQKVITPAEQPKMPDVEWNWNETKVDAVILNKDNNIIKAKEIEAFVNKLEIANLGPGNIKKLVNAGFDTIPKILSIRVEDIIPLPGFKEKSANKIVNSIKTQVNTMSLSSLMGSVNVFGRGMGEKRIRIILKNYPNILTSKETNDEKINKIADLNGFAKKTATLFVEKIPQFMEFIENTNLQNKLEEFIKSNSEEKKQNNHPLNNKKIKISGFRDKEFQKQLEIRGADLQTNISKKTDFVIVKDMDDLSDKVQKAVENNIRVLTKSEFEKKYM